MQAPRSTAPVWTCSTMGSVSPSFTPEYMIATCPNTLPAPYPRKIKSYALAQTWTRDHGLGQTCGYSLLGCYSAVNRSASALGQLPTTLLGLGPQIFTTQQQVFVARVEKLHQHSEPLLALGCSHETVGLRGRTKGLVMGRKQSTCLF